MNYQLELEKIMKEIEGRKPSLLLHACCAPCSSYCLEYLSNYFDITLYFYNPNITSKEEYEKRFMEFKKIQESICSVQVIKEEYNSEEFYRAIKGLENCLEGGERCFVCYELRLNKTAQFAKDNNFDYFASTLSISPHKNAEKLNEIGKKLEIYYNIKWLPNDFKKKGGYYRSTTLSKELGLYRQDYCGCIYSKKEREKCQQDKN